MLTLHKGDSNEKAKMFYIDRALGCDRYHCNPGFNAASRAEQRPGKS
jgi:hypothetical protein